MDLAWIYHETISRWHLISSQYSMYGHIHKLALAEQAGLKKAGIEADLFQYEPPCSSISHPYTDSILGFRRPFHRTF